MISGKNNNIFFDYFPSSRPGTQALVLLAGLPARPKAYELIGWFKDAGFDVFAPRYEGTWESDGKFLSPSPVNGINCLINSIHERLILEGFEYCSENIYVLGASFGGGIALSIDDTEYLKKVCVLSPVISFGQVNGIETLNTYLNSAFPNEYEFQVEDWEKLIKDEIFCPLKETKPAPSKIMLVAGKEDDQISSLALKRYAEDKNISKYLLEDTGHITLSKVNRELFEKIESFFKD